MTRGGKRKGAGSKPQLENPRTIAVILDDPALDRLEMIRAGVERVESRPVSRSRALRIAIANCEIPE